jgi:hypothetical protein
VLELATLFSRIPSWRVVAAFVAVLCLVGTLLVAAPGLASHYYG